MGPSDPRFANAKTERYLIGPLLSWAVSILLILWVCSRILRTKIASHAFAAICLLLLPIALWLRWWADARNQMFANQQLAALGIEDNMFDPGVMKNVFPWDPGYPKRCSEILRAGHLAMFYKGHAKWLGRSAREFCCPAADNG